MKHFFVFALLIQVWLLGCAARIGEMPAAKRSQELAMEKARVLRLTDPVGKTRSYIKISEYLIEFIGDAARAHDVGGLNSFVDEYKRAIQGARDTIANSGRDPERRPQGYKDLELSLRNHSRRLADLQTLLLADERETLESAFRLAAEIREEMLSLLFPLTKPAGASG